jgi:outer membrane protein assembly complex protein YaeT
MVLRTNPAAKGGGSSALTPAAAQADPAWNRTMSMFARRSKALLVCAIFLVAAGAAASFSQSVPAAAAAGSPSGAAKLTPAEPLTGLEGLEVKRITFEGVGAERLKPFAGHLPQAEGQPLSADAVGNSLRELYSTGLYESVQAEGVRTGGGVELIFRGLPRMFVGTVSLDGARGTALITRLTSASQLSAGTRLTDAVMNSALDSMQRTLIGDGFHQATIAVCRTPHADEQLVDLAFHVNQGPQARVGAVEVSGDAGMSLTAFCRRAHLRAGSRIDRDTVSRALNGVLKYYQRQERLEAEVKLVQEQYDPVTKKSSFRFSAVQGPVVKVLVEGASIEPERVRKLVPVFEEGSVDEDLLNEGNRRLRNYYQGMGYFDARAEHREQSSSPGQVTIVYQITQGERRRVEHVSIEGNRYFSAGTLHDLLSVREADTLDRHGSYSQALVSADVAALEGVYRNNGFSHVKVTAETGKPGSDAGESSASPSLNSKGDPSTEERAAAADKTAPLDVTYHIDEGEQLRVGALRMEGNDHMAADKLTPLLNTLPGQPLSPQNLARDRDALLSAYLSQGFEEAEAEVVQQAGPAAPEKVDVVFRIHEGQQVFVRKVLVTGLHFTRPEVVEKAITLKPGAPLDDASLRETQRNLYDLTLFNEVNTAIENPTGGEPYKNILLQAVEARRWALTYGFGFESQTGQPQTNCASAFAAGVSCSPNGKTGVSPRILADITRNNLLGREQSISLQGTYGLLEQKINLLYQLPRFSKNLGFTFSGGYANSEDVSTYVASRLDGEIRWTQKFLDPNSSLSKANTFVYEINFRRVKVAEDTLQVFPGELTELATAVRVAGPAFTWIRDTRDSAIDARRGTYTSFQEFVSTRLAGSQAEFNRLDLSNSSYYSFDKNRFVLARNTRWGQVRAFGAGKSQLIPLPERLYAGGPTSLRGFSQNAAGPRDPETGYPIGGSGALINSTELRTPAPTLPLIGNTVGFVIFHDMGNIFTNARDAWAGALRTHQPDSAACRNLATVGDANSYIPTGAATSTGKQGDCSFNDFSHAVGLGLRYRTPVGPIRFDFSYNLNPPIYPVNINYSIPNAAGSAIPGYESAPHLGQAPHFNFFFSLGQAF